jgi:hypothetical protein
MTLMIVLLIVGMLIQNEGKLIFLGESSSLIRLILIMGKGSNWKEEAMKNKHHLQVQRFLQTKSATKK